MRVYVSVSYTKKDLKLNWYKTGVWLHELSLSSFDVQVDDLREYFLLEDDEGEQNPFLNLKSIQLPPVTQTYP